MNMEIYRKIMDAKTDMLKHLGEGLRSWTSCACIAIVFDTHHHISPNQACHAGLSNNYKGNKDRGAHAVVSALMKPAEKEELYEDEAFMFLDWLLNRSPYSEVFITKSAHEALYTKTIIASAHHPSNLMAAGLVASRRLWEYAYVARVFCDLVKAGVNEDLAFFLGHCYYGRFDGSGLVSFKKDNSGHCSLSTGMSPEALKNFLEHKPVNLNKTYHENYHYTGYDGMYGPGAYAGSMGRWIHNNFPYKAAVAGKVANPFPVDREVGHSCTYEHLIKTCVDFQHKIFEHIGYQQPVKQGG